MIQRYALTWFPNRNVYRIVTPGSVNTIALKKSIVLRKPTEEKEEEEGRSTNLPMIFYRLFLTQAPFSIPTPSTHFDSYIIIYKNTIAFLRI